MIDGQPLACFQPFIDTATGRIAGVEALGRLRQADGRLQSVGPLFADPRTPGVALRRLDRQIRDNALSRLHEAPEDWFLSLNISPRWITRLRPGQALPSLQQVQAHGVDPQRIVFEITELGGDIQRLAEVVARYREAGARIARPVRASRSTTSVPVTPSLTGCSRCNRTSSNWICVCSRPPPEADQAATWCGRWRRWRKRPVAGSLPKAWKPKRN